MKNRILLLTAMIAGCMLTVSCSKDGGNGGGGDKTTTYGKVYAPIKNLDIVGAEYLYTVKSETELSPDARTRSTITTDVSQLFKVLSSGNTEEVVVIDSNGETIPVTNIIIQQATDDLIYFCYEYEIKTWIEYEDEDYGYWGETTVYTHSYFVRTSDGGVFEIPDQFSGAILSAYKDNNQNLYCAVLPNGNNDYDGPSAPPTTKDIYKIESKSGVNATKIASTVPILRATSRSHYGEDIAWTVDKLGNVLYINNYGNARCAPPDGEEFILDVSELWTDDDYYIPLKTGEVIPAKNVIVVNRLIPIMNSTTGGFVMSVTEFDEWNNYIGEYLAHCTINKQTKRLDATRLCDYYHGEWITLADRIVIIGNGVITTIKSPTDIETVTCQTPVGNYTTTGNYMYWVDNNQIYRLDYTAGNSSMLYQLNSSW